MRNLDLTTLRSFVAVAETGGVTRAAGALNLTQSAVSMQLKRLEELLDLSLLDRSARRIALTESGDQLLGYARRMIEMNDEILSRLTDQSYEGEIMLGVPYDIVYPVIPQVLKRFNVEFPRMKIQLRARGTRDLKEQFERGGCDLILTTETGIDSDGETLVELPLRWIGAPGGTAWRKRPVRMAFGRHCMFRPGVISALEEAGLEWEMAVESESDRTIEATISADLAIHAMLEGTQPPHLEQIDHCAALPALAVQKINMYGADRARSVALKFLSDLLRQTFRSW